MSFAMRMFFGGLLVGLSAQWGWGQETFGFDGVIRHFAVGTNSVYVVTDDRLYQLGHKLTPLQTRCQRGLQVDCKNMDGQCFHKASEMDRWNATFMVNTLLPFIKNNTLITCGKTVCGYCELLDLNNISKIVHEEIIDVGSVIPKGLYVGILVDVKLDMSSETYILTAQANTEKCKTDMEAVTLYNTLDRQKGGIFSKTGVDGSPRIRSKHIDVEFVDGFQIDTTIFLFSILPSKPGGIRLLWLQSTKSKLETFNSLRGATLNSSEDGINRIRLLSSSVIPGSSPVHWAGVFSANDTRNPVNTILAVYDINPPPFNMSFNDPDFCPIEKCDIEKFDAIPDLKPMIIVFKYSSMTSVLSVRKNSWVVFIIGTGDGQLIKIAVDENYKATCPQVFHLEDNESPVFPVMHLDPVDPNYVYVALTDQVKRIPVAKCGAHNTFEDCWFAQDPFCGWCDTTKSCTFEDECLDSTWMSIPQDSSQKNMVSYQVEMDSSGQEIKLTIQNHLSVRGKVLSAFSCNFSPEPFSSHPHDAALLRCSCTYSTARVSAGGLDVSVRIRVGQRKLIKKLKMTNCSEITGPPTSILCQQCITAGCSWSDDVCSWTHKGTIHQNVCQMNMSGIIHPKPVITSVTPNVLSLYGSNSALLSGINLSHVTMVRMQQEMACSPKESRVWNNTGVSLMFRIPAGDKGIVRVCAVLPDGSCHGSARITYGPSPVCTSLEPDSSWASGKRKIGVKGSNMKFVDFVSDHNLRKIQSSSAETLEYHSSSAERGSKTNVSLRVANQSLACPTMLTYHPDPTFISFTSTKKGNDISITIQKKADNLQLRPEELYVLGLQGERRYNCVRTSIEPSIETDSVVCEIPNSLDTNIQFLKVTYGDVTVRVDSPQTFYPLMLLLLLLFPLILGVGLFIYRNEQRKHRAQMNNQLEMLECDIRNEIRQGFVDLQMEKSDLIENNGAIPFLDYKHFASRIFFPEGGALVTSCIKDIGQDGVSVQPDEPCQNLAKLIQNPLFLTSVIHALEEQKGFTVKDKCAVASLLTVALHGNLPYLTQMIEELLRNLMEKANTQPKLMLRRTESIVEKLLTNWMSICLYGFLRESVGQHLFLLVSALAQQISKGPVDSITEKALYTLNEDWLLWQAQDFSSLKLLVLFAVGTDGEVSEPLEVNVLDCDTVEQVKEKILMAFKAKFGFPYNTPLRDLRIEYERDKKFVALEEVDASSVVVGDVTMLNTLKHYKIPDGASIKVISKGTHLFLCHQSSIKEDENFSTKYYHLIDPEVDKDQEKNPERKKIKLKEVHLTKLLSTKVAVHSFVENLFKTIWGTINCKAPHAVKFFFDFLDAQADSKKISDPDVLHIWKTNSLPLRFWVNILKNPQFVFDMEKTPHMDSCLSVIAQAFMDSFSLSESQLGKHAPTNKLLYAKDIPQYKQEVKAYYKQIRDQPSITNTEFKDFLQEESKKHENEFNESVALRALYKFIHQYFDEIKQKLEQNEAPAELNQQLQHVKIQFDSLKSCSWN